MSLDDIRRAIDDEKAAIDAAHAAVAEAREALEQAQTALTEAERAERAAIIRSETRIAALEMAAQSFDGDHGVDSPLHNPHGNASLKGMHTAAGIPGVKLKSKNLAAVRIRAVDGSIGAFAKKHKFRSASTVYSWYAKGGAARKIPERWAAKLEKLPYSIPRSAWPNGIDTDGQ